MSYQIANRHCNRTLPARRMGLTLTPKMAQVSELTDENTAGSAGVSGNASRSYGRDDKLYQRQRNGKPLNRGKFYGFRNLQRNARRSRAHRAHDAGRSPLGRITEGFRLCRQRIRNTDSYYDVGRRRRPKLSGNIIRAARASRDSFAPNCFLKSHFPLWYVKRHGICDLATEEELLDRLPKRTPKSL